MPARARAAALVSALAVAGGLLTEGCTSAALSRTSATSGASTGPSPGAAPARLTITPAIGKPSTDFTFAFTAPNAVGRQGHTRLGYQLAVLGPERNGCLGARTAAVPVAAAGQPVALSLDPGKLGGVWCQGDYTVRVSEVQTPVCSPNQMCPQYIRVVGIVARGTFRVLAP